MKLKNNLKNFAKYIASTLNRFAKNVKDTSKTFLDKEKSDNSDSFKTKLKKIEEEKIVNVIDDWKTKLRKLEKEVWGLGVNDILVISPENKIPKGKSHSIGESNKELLNYYDAIPNGVFSSVKKEKSINDDYMLLSSSPTELEIPHFNCEESKVDRYDQWLTIDESLTSSDILISGKRVVNNAFKQNIRKSDGLSCIHSPGFEEESRSQLNKNISYPEVSQIEIPHFDNNEKVIRIYLSNDIKDLSPQFEFDYNKEYISCTGFSPYILIEDEDLNQFYFEIKVKIIKETYSFFNENEFILVKCIINGSIKENFYIEVKRNGIFIKEVGTIIENGKINDDLYDTILYKKVLIPINDEDDTTSFYEEEIPDIILDAQGKPVVQQDPNKKDFIKENFFVNGAIDEVQDEEGNKVLDKDGNVVYDYFYDDGIYIRSNKDTYYVDNNGGSFSTKIYIETNTEKIRVNCISISTNSSITDSFYCDYENSQWEINSNESVYEFPVTFSIEENIITSSPTTSTTTPTRGGLFLIYFSDQGEDKILNSYYIFKFVQLGSKSEQDLTSDEIPIFNETQVRFLSSLGKLNESLTINPYVDKKVVGHELTNAFSSSSIINKDTICASPHTKLSNYIPTFIVSSNSSHLSVYIFLHRTSLIPGDEYLISLSKERNKYNNSKIEILDGVESFDVYLNVAKEKNTSNSGEYDNQFWNPEDIASGLSINNGSYKNSYATSMFPPNLMDVFYKGTSGISFLLKKNYLDGNDDYNVDAGEKNTLFSIGSPEIGPKGNYLIQAQYISYTNSYWLDLRHTGTNEWAIEESDEKYNSYFSQGVVYIDKSLFNKDCNNFIILKKFNYNNIPIQQYNSYIPNNPPTNISYFNYGFDSNTNKSIKSSDIITACKNIHMYNKIDLSMGYNNFSENTYGPFYVGKFDSSKDSDYYIEIIPSMNSFSLMSGMQAEAMGPQYIEASQLSSIFNIDVFIGEKVDNENNIGKMEISTSFKEEIPSTYNLINTWTRESSSSIGRKKVYYTTSFSGTTYIWSLFEGKRFVDKDKLILILSKEELNKYKDLKEEYFSIPLLFKITHNGKLYTLSMLTIKCYEKLH